ncbi:hypothetical protein D3C78_1823830 [compost metagenome]
MGAAQACAIQLQAQAVDQRARFGEGLHVAGVGVHRHHGLGATGKLYLGHGMERPAQSIPGVG